MKKLNIGLFGFGVVGEGIYQILEAKPGLQCTVKRICIKHAEKPRNAPIELFTTQKDDILEDDEIDVIVELIDDDKAALDIVTKAMRKGKQVVSANKKMIAENQKFLIDLQKKTGVSFLYEAAVCGSIPILRNLEEYFDNDLLENITGIVNGSTNYILCKMGAEQKSYDECLKIAQEKGFAESNPTLDVEGHDASYKLGIIALHAFGKLIDPGSILRKGITSLQEEDFAYAREKGYKIKLVAAAKWNAEHDALHTSILPCFLSSDQKLTGVDDEYNGILVGGELAEEQFLYGKGAGRFPTASAVLSDISALRYGYKYERKKGARSSTLINDAAETKVYVASHDKTAIDTRIFKHIEASYETPHRKQVIGTLNLDDLQTHTFWKKSEVSLIAFA